MLLTALACENYKAFEERARIEIRPITILIGKNSSGKSVLSRLPLLLGRALSGDADSPLEMTFDGLDFGASTVDLIHNRVPHGAIFLEAEFGQAGETWSVSAKVQHYDEYKLQQIANFDLCGSGFEPLRLAWVGKDPTIGATKYRIGKTREVGEVEFRGLLPVSVRTKKEADNAFRSSLRHLLAFRNRVEADMKAVRYLGPFRQVAERSYRYSPGVVSSVGSRGAAAAALSGEDYLRRGGEVLGAVGKWFHDHLGGWALEVVPFGEAFALVMTHPERPSVKVNIADVGAGIAQVLPIVVQRHFDIHYTSGSNLEIVEQPELHLHQAAHGDLADLYIRTVNVTPRRFLIETHSEIFLLRIRRRIAWGELDPDAVRIYWVSQSEDGKAKVRPITILPDGEVDYWPPGIFSEDFEEVKAIRRGQQDKRYEGNNRPRGVK